MSSGEFFEIFIRHLDLKLIYHHLVLFQGGIKSISAILTRVISACNCGKKLIHIS